MVWVDDGTPAKHILWGRHSRSRLRPNIEHWTRKFIQIQDVIEATQNGFMFPTFSASWGLGIGPASSSEVDNTRQFSQEIRLASNPEGAPAVVVRRVLQQV
jgi:hypothetical protein